MNVKSLSGADLARCFGVDRAMVTRWKKAGMPDHNGLYNLPECIRWRLDKEADAMAPKSSTTEGDRWMTVFRKERAMMARMERKRLRGELLKRSELLPEWVEVYQEFRQSCLTMENKLPDLLEGLDREEIRREIKKYSRAMLTTLARPGVNRPAPEAPEKPRPEKTPAKKPKKKATKKRK